MEPNTKDTATALDQIEKIEAKAKQMLDLCATLRRALKVEAGDVGEDRQHAWPVEEARKQAVWVVVDMTTSLSVFHQRSSMVRTGIVLTEPETWTAAQARMERAGAFRGWSRWSETKYAPIPQKS